MEEAESVADCPVEDPLGREEEDGKEEEAGESEDAISVESVEESVLEAPVDKIEEEGLDISGLLEDGRLDSEVEKDAVVEGLKVVDAKEVSEKEMLEAGPDVDDSRDVEASGEDGEDEGPVEAVAAVRYKRKESESKVVDWSPYLMLGQRRKIAKRMPLRMLKQQMEKVGRKKSLMRRGCSPVSCLCFHLSEILHDLPVESC